VAKFNGPIGRFLRVAFGVMVICSLIQLVRELFPRRIAVSSDTISIETVDFPPKRFPHLHPPRDRAYDQFRIVPVGRRYARIEFCLAGKRVELVGATVEQGKALEYHLIGPLREPESEVLS
jgi:hypothetical protein